MDMVRRGDMMSIDDVTEILSTPLIGIDSKAGRAYANICRRIDGEDIPFTDIDENNSLFSKLTHLFKKN